MHDLAVCVLPSRHHALSSRSDWGGKRTHPVNRIGKNTWTHFNLLVPLKVVVLVVEKFYQGYGCWNSEYQFTCTGRTGPNKLA